MLVNRFEQPDSVITRLRAGPIEKYDRDMNERFELSADEKEKPGYIGNILTLESVWQTRDGRIVDTTRLNYNKEKGKHFCLLSYQNKIKKIGHWIRDASGFGYCKKTTDSNDYTVYLAYKDYFDRWAQSKCDSD